jgi:hypothetical protein
MRLFQNKPQSTPHKKSISIIDNADAVKCLFAAFPGLPLVTNNDF